MHFSRETGEVMTRVELLALVWTGHVVHSQIVAFGFRADGRVGRCQHGGVRLARGYLESPTPVVTMVGTATTMDSRRGFVFNKGKVRGLEARCLVHGPQRPCTRGWTSLGGRWGIYVLS